MQYVTYEALFNFAELLFVAINTFASIITLIVAIVKMQNIDSNSEKKRKK